MGGSYSGLVRAYSWECSAKLLLPRAIYKIVGTCMIPPRTEEIPTGKIRVSAQTTKMKPLRQPLVLLRRQDHTRIRRAKSQIRIKKDKTKMTMNNSKGSKLVMSLPSTSVHIEH